MSTAPNFVGTATEAQRIAQHVSQFKALAKAVSGNIRCAMPGIVESFDAVKQTVTVDVAVYDKIKLNGVVSDRKIPTLLDVPLVFPRGGGYSITFPVKTGDEVLVIFADMCIDSWFDAGGYNNVQNRLRRHDLSDGFAILAPTSQPKALPNWDASGVQLRNDAGTAIVGIEGTTVTITAPAVVIGDGGANQSLMTDAFLTWFTTNIIPFLESKGYSGPAPPDNSVSSIVKAQ